MAQHFPVTLIGETTRRLLLPGSLWRVAAVFWRSFYCQDNQGTFICLGPPSIGPGPLNAICSISESIQWMTYGLQSGTLGEFDGNTLQVDGQFSFLFSEARSWQPEPMPKQWDRRTLTDVLASVQEELADRTPQDGFGPIIRALVHRRSDGNGPSCVESPLVRVALPGIESLGYWLREKLLGNRRGYTPIPPHVEMLIGLGPGLTPSGDDLLGGTMIALHAFGRSDVAKRLAHYVLPLARHRTHPISFAHLVCAAQGEGASALHNLLSALCSRGRSKLSECLDAIDAIGFTSGWDALAGAWVALRVLMEVPDQRFLT